MRVQWWYIHAYILFFSHSCIHRPTSSGSGSVVSPMSPPYVTSSVEHSTLSPKSPPPPILPKPSVKLPVLPPKPPNLVVVTAENGERRSTLYTDVKVKDPNDGGVRDSSFDEVAYVTVKRHPT